MAQKLCRRCILPDSFPGVEFNELGLCQYCQRTPVQKRDLGKLREEAESTIRSHIGKSKTYDVALAFSGGKDSTYTLKYLKENFQARIIAITIDNDFISEVAYRNCRQVPAALGVDHIFFKPNPKAMMNIYNQSLNNDIHDIGALKRASAICNSCIQVINTQLINFAGNYQIPIVAGGYIGGQIPSESGVMRQNLRVTQTLRKPFMEKVSESMGEEALQLFEQQAGNQKEILVVNPMIYLNKSEEQLVEEISPLGWEKPKDTGKSSTNCLLNDYAIFTHQQKHNFHPYVFELAKMTRDGLISREEALKKVSTSFGEEDFKETQKRLSRFK